MSGPTIANWQDNAEAWADDLAERLDASSSNRERATILADELEAAASVFRRQPMRTVSVSSVDVAAMEALFRVGLMARSCAKQLRLGATR